MLYLYLISLHNMFTWADIYSIDAIALLINLLLYNVLIDIMSQMHSLRLGYCSGIQTR